MTLEPVCLLAARGIAALQAAAALLAFGGHLKVPLTGPVPCLCCLVADASFLLRLWVCLFNSLTRFLCEQLADVDARARAGWLRARRR